MLVTTFNCMIDCWNYVPYLLEMIRRNTADVRREVTLEVEPPDEKDILMDIIADM